MVKKRKQKLADKPVNKGFMLKSGAITTTLIVIIIIKLIVIINLPVCPSYT